MKTVQIVQTGLKRVGAGVLWGMIAFVLAGAAQPEVAAGAPVALRCSAPGNAAERMQCADLERKALDATVFLRFTLHCGPANNRSSVALVPSHATIVDSRTLLTHDHFYPLSDPACVVTALELATARGVVLAEIADAAILADVAGQLQPDRGGNSRQTRLARFGAPLFTPVPDLSFEMVDRTGSRTAFADTGELAEINWESYPQATRVQWARPVALERRGDALGLVVDRAAEVGASGGGVFRITPTGIAHVGNIWGTWHDDDTSIVALNQ